VLWGKNKEGQVGSCSQLNMTTDCAHDEEEHNKPNTFELEEATSAPAGERV
jgi:hypothetical protein